MNGDIGPNTFRVTCVKENEDGSAQVEVEVGSEETKNRIFEDGINFLLLKGILEGTTDDVLRWAQLGKQKEKTDRLVDAFIEIYIENTK
jgi:hypothetical protein